MHEPLQTHVRSYKFAEITGKQKKNVDMSKKVDVFGEIARFKNIMVSINFIMNTEVTNNKIRNKYDQKAHQKT